jgi:hypothetical protein
MAEFTWVPAPPYGTCLSCGTSQNDRGFVDTFAEVNVKNEAGEIVGVVDAVFCAQCIEQMGNRVGMASKAETEAFAYRELGLVGENDQLKDEVKSWQERFDTIVSESFSAQVRKVIEEVESEKEPDPPPKETVVTPGPKS